MTVRGMEHINLRLPAKSLAAVRAFYCDVLGLEAGPRPALRSSGLWLYAGQSPIVHLVEISDTEYSAAPSVAASSLDHVAFRCSDIHQILERLRCRGIEHVVNEVPAAGQMQVRLRDPSGLPIELIFPLAPPAAVIPPAHSPGQSF